ncbi:hypothetical protein [Pseudomonas costantinii]|uniref:Uncharacterized protein n=1 Tax=Pseudomonas costantinii TaxID=168469 RepID=A0A1S2V3W9_9PSED|nr:hypothetical protein [Pseudomonas costantinii]OIN53160.1 hypothetical protein BFL40_12060 [Pseudomonas costantinii]
MINLKRVRQSQASNVSEKSCASLEEDILALKFEVGFCLSEIKEYEGRWSKFQLLWPGALLILYVLAVAASLWTGGHWHWVVVVAIGGALSLIDVVIEEKQSRRIRSFYDAVRVWRSAERHLRNARISTLARSIEREERE